MSLARESIIEEVRLNMSDPIHKALYELILILASKGHDYTEQDDPASGFRSAAEHLDVEPYKIVELHILNKLSRLRTLRKRGNDPLHESVKDTYKDLAGYGVLAYALYGWEHKDVEF